MRKLKYVKLFEKFDDENEFIGTQVTIDFDLSQDPTIKKLGNPGQSISAKIGGIDKEEKKILFLNPKTDGHIFTIKYYDPEPGVKGGFYQYDNVTDQKLGGVKEANQGKTLDRIRNKYDINGSWVRKNN